MALAAPLPAARVEADYPLLLAAGLLVGIGTRYGSGCTSGHGVCGLSRRSPRSLAATLAFMVAGFLTVYVVRHVLCGRRPWVFFVALLGGMVLFEVLEALRARKG